MELEWEGVMDSDYQRSTGGQALEEGSVFQVPTDMDLQALGVRGEDWLQVTSGVVSSAECTQYVERPCLLEQRIESIVFSTGQLTLSTPLPAACLIRQLSWAFRSALAMALWCVRMGVAIALRRGSVLV